MKSPKRNALDDGSLFDCPQLYNRRSYSLNSLWSVWYCTLAMVFQVYIIATSIQRFTGYLSLPWPNGQPPFAALNSFVVLIGIGVVILPFFVVVAMMKVGNYSNDGHKLGDQINDYTELNKNLYQSVRSQEIKKKKSFRSCKLIWKHGIPTAPFLHMIAALCFLLPRLLMEAQLIKHGFVGKGNIWKTELDFILSKFEDKRMKMLSFLNTISDGERGLLNMDSYNVNQYLTKEPHNFNKQSQVFTQLEQSDHLSLELINFTISLFILAVRYPSVFWKTSKFFGIIFSIQMTYNIIQSLIIYSAFQILFKVIVCDPTKILVNLKSNLMLTSSQAVMVFVIYIFMITFSSISMYLYGLQKYKEWKMKQLKRMRITLPQKDQKLCGYFPHFCALVSFALMGLSAAPMFHDLTVIYCRSLDSAVLIGMISTIFHLFFYIIIWFFLTLKNKWKFIMDNKNPLYKSISQKSLHSNRGETPLLIIGNGKTYQIREPQSKKAILNVAQKYNSVQKHISPDENEDIYWLKPKQISPSEKSTDESSITWLKNENKNKEDKCEDNKSNKIKMFKSLRKLPKSPKNTIKQKKSLEKVKDFDEFYDSEGEYATLKQIVNNNISNDMATHMNLCPLREETVNLPNPVMVPSTDGDYELFVEHQYNTNTHQELNYNQSHQTPIVIHTENDGINLTSTPIASNSTFIKEQINQESLTPRSCSISEASNSPEKASDTSSGVHSGSSNGVDSNTPSLNGDKRSASMEDMVQQIQSMAMPNPCFKSLSLQRYISSMTGRSIPQSSNESHSDGQPVVNSMVIRRMKPASVSNKINQTETATATAGDQYFGRSSNLRMTSFIDKDYYRTNSLPYGVKMSPFGNNQYSNRIATLPNPNQNFQKQMQYKPGVCMPPQYPLNANLYHNNRSHNDLQRRSSFSHPSSTYHNGIYS